MTLAIHFMYTLIGYGGGLHFLLNAEQHDYVFNNVDIASEAGFFIKIHDPDIRDLRPVNNAYFAPVGSATRISMQKEKVKS